MKTYKDPSAEKHPRFKYALEERVLEGKVVQVYDGDTITVLLNPWPADPLSYEWRWKVRLLGYDSDEIKQPLKDPNRDALKARAYAAKEELEDLVFGKVVTLQCEKFDSFGRILANVYVGDLHVNNYMIEKGHLKKD